MDDDGPAPGKLPVISVRRTNWILGGDALLHRAFQLLAETAALLELMPAVVAGYKEIGKLPQ
jgi:hypothetical protein